MKFITDLTAWFHKCYSPFRLYKIVFVSEIPDSPESFRLYVAGENEYLWFAAMVCPCGCREVLYMNLQKDTRPCWDLTSGHNASPSLHPSVWRQKGCYSHFWLKNGRVKWC